MLPRFRKIATSTKKKRGSQDPPEGREDKGSIGVDNMDNGQEKEKDNGKGIRNSDNTDRRKKTEMDKDKNEYKCCGKVFRSYQGLRIHQGKVCKRKEAQHRRSADRQTIGSVPQEANHSGKDPTLEQRNATEGIGDRKPKIKWPKASETAKYKQFDEDVNKMLMKMKGTTE